VKSPGRSADSPEVSERVYERSALILDGVDHPLAQVSGSLSVLGHRFLYSDDLCELVRIAPEQQVGALLLPARCAAEIWPEVHKQLVEPLGLAPRSVLLVGDAIAESDAASLHVDGLRWALRPPFTPWDLRFAVNLVLAESDANEARIATRVPCSIPVDVES